MAITTWAGLVAIAALAANPAVGTEPPAAPGTLRIGMPEGMFRDVPPTMVQAMSRPFRSLFEKQTGLAGDVAIVTDGAEIASQLKAAKLHLGVFHGFEFARARAADADLTPIVVTVPPGRTLQAVVVVNRSHKAATLADLGADAVTIPRGIKAHCLCYFDKARIGLPADVAKANPKPTQTTEEVLNAVAEGTLPAALVDAGAFTAYEGLQPGGAKLLRVLCKSELFPVSVVAYRKGTLSDAAVGKVRTGLIGAGDTAAGKPLMMLWNLKGFEEVPADYTKQLDAVLAAYPAK